MSADTPNIRRGIRPVIPATKGAAIPPILATVEPNPTAVLRIDVGYSSAAYMYTIEKQAEPPNLPAR